MLFDPPAAVAMVVENIKEKNINDIKDLKTRCASTTDISMGMRGEIQVTGGHISEGLYSRAFFLFACRWAYNCGGILQFVLVCVSLR